MEGAKVVHPLSDTNPFDWNRKLRLDSNGYTALGRPVQFRKHNTRNGGCLCKDFCLADRILPRSGIEYKQSLMRRSRDFTSNHTIDLLKFLHEIRLRLETPCRINDNNVDISGFCGL